jgi:hypothetical protein
MLLAIGGPKNFEWLPDYGYQSLVVPIMPPSNFIFKSEPHPTDLLEYETVIYYKRIIADGSLRKEVYVEMDFLGDPLKALKDYLLEQFMLMEDPTS